MAKVYIGTSGFMYRHWKEVFYPKGLSQSKWFEYYCQHFKTVELNVSFYRLPKKETFISWQKAAGSPTSGFTFSIKGSRYITHIKRLKDCREAVERFFENADPLGGLTSKEVRPQQGKNVVLWQLPPRFKANPERLEEFLKALAHLRGVPQAQHHLGGGWRPSQTGQPRQTWRQAFEFRDKSWLDKEIYELLQKYNSAIVFQDFPDWPRTTEYTELVGKHGLEKLPFIYYRFHGAKSLYSSNYSDKELKKIAAEIRIWLNKGKDVYAYFNNDALGYAVENALMLKALVKSV